MSKRITVYFFPLDISGVLLYNKSVMKFLELTVHTSSEASELVADAMWEFTPHGVTVCDSNDIVALQKNSSVFWDYMDDTLSPDPNADVLVKCYFSLDDADKISALIREIARRKACAEGAVNFGTLEETKREIEGDDWIDVWKKHFRPIRLGKIVVVPEWIKYEKQAGEEIVLLDSNMAFGTGEHETTSMCVMLMQKYLRAGDEVLDIGCGSGILGIAAAKLGAKKCYLTDLDPIAVESAKHNAERNGVADRVRVTEANLVGDSQVRCDVALANITAEVLALLAPSVGGNLKENGTLILSGIIKERLGFVKDTYARAGFAVCGEQTLGEWCALVLKKERRV